ncbi:MAG: hypothetical protein GF384_05780, partial [Elusimicrobia bacterium]|nr:hypothetical protein [Elusimicrobiota bacterium]
MKKLIQKAIIISITAVLIAGNKMLVYAVDEWRVLPIRSEEEFNQGRTGGESEQHPHGIARCLNHPEFIYISHDVAQVWRSTDNGDTWKHTLGKNLYLTCGQSIEVDPVDPSIVFFTVAHSYNYLQEDYEGLYRSKDYGDTWELVLQTDTNYISAHRIYRHNIAYDPSTINQYGATRWYAAFPDNGLYRSENSGDTWEQVDSLVGYTVVYGVQVHPGDGVTVYVATNKGLLKSSSRGSDLEIISNLGQKNVSGLQIHPEKPNIIYATVKQDGLYRSEDAGETFILLKSFDAQTVFMNPGFPDTMYLVGVSANTIISHDAGQTWITDMITNPFPGLGRAGSGWKGRIAGGATGIVPHPEVQDEAVAFSRASLWKTTDGGHVFDESSTLFTGYAWSWWNDGIAFDPFNKNRLVTFNCDVGMCITHTAGDYFEGRNAQAWGWYQGGLIKWIGAYSGHFQPVEHSQIIIASVGGYFQTQIMRSTNEGKEWQLVTQGPSNVSKHLFISFHPDDPDFVYAGNKIS